MLKSFRYVLLPFSFVYAIIVTIRNWLFDKDYLKSAAFNFPIICVGNLAVGGTGKTPMVEYLLRMLGNDYAIATLSRGYKRKTVGYGIANENTTALEIGDEPMQFHLKFPNVAVAVGEERLVAIPQLLHDRPATEIIILDDAFQHRSVKAGLNILLTEHKNLYSRDLLMPAGDLRDRRSSAKRAEIIIVTKCNHDLTIGERDLILAELNPTADQTVFFTEILYGRPYHLFSKKTFTIPPDNDLLLVCGIANPEPLQEFLTPLVRSYDMLSFPDHHVFSIDDMEEIKKQFEKMTSANKVIVTTEKDGVRLAKFENDLQDYPIYVLPIEHSFMFNDAARFYERVQIFISSLNTGNKDKVPQDQPII
ncbi:MAG: tetraacyldisaccharide 4-kinase [Ferruginibacter sp.]|nr:tetraacyldisaccharide 4-kinase [Ferruginibacter sp.]